MVILDWWPLTRDCLAYGITVSILICIIHDERVEWYEALCLVLLYIVYIFIMYYDKSIQRCARGESQLPTSTTSAISKFCNETDQSGGSTLGTLLVTLYTFCTQAVSSKLKSTPEDHGNLV